MLFRSPHADRILPSSGSSTSSEKITASARSSSILLGLVSKYRQPCIKQDADQLERPEAVEIESAVFRGIHHNVDVAHECGMARRQKAIHRH